MLSHAERSRTVALEVTMVKHQKASPLELLPGAQLVPKHFTPFGIRNVFPTFQAPNPSPIIHILSHSLAFTTAAK